MSGSLRSISLINPCLVVMDLKEQTQLSVGYAIFASPGSTFDLPEVISLSSSEEMKVCLSKRGEINRGF